MIPVAATPQQNGGRDGSNSQAALTAGFIKAKTTKGGGKAWQLPRQQAQVEDLNAKSGKGREVASGSLGGGIPRPHRWEQQLGVHSDNAKA